MTVGSTPSELAVSATERDPGAVAKFVERFAADLAESGFPRMPARVFAALLVTDSGQLSAAELAETLQVSPAAVSGAVRYLIQVGMIRREREPGTRRDTFLVYDGVWSEMVKHPDQMWKKMEATLAEGVAAVGTATGAGLRIAESVAFFEYLRVELPKLVAAWEAVWATRRAEQG